jgi:hypothetical protein
MLLHETKTASFEEYKEPYWFLTLEFLDTQKLVRLRHKDEDIVLVAGRSIPDDENPHFINLAPYGYKTGISSEHFSINLTTKRITVLALAKNPIYLNGSDPLNKVEKGGTRKLTDGDIINIGEIQITIKFASGLRNIMFWYRLFQLRLQQYGRQKHNTDRMKERERGEELPLGIEPDPNKWVVSEKDGVKYPKKMLEVAEELMEETDSTWEEAIQEVIMFDEAERNPTPTEPTESIIAFFKPSGTSKST